MTDPLWIYSARDSIRITIDSLCITMNMNQKQLLGWVWRDGMPDPREGASFDKCMDWVYKNKYTDTDLAKDVGLRPAKIQMLKKKGMPIPRDGATLDEIKEWIKNHFRENFSTYGMEKTLGVCRKTIKAFLMAGMPNPADGVCIEICESWIQVNISRLNPIWRLVKESEKSYDTLLRNIKKHGMPDPREGATINQCLKWLNRKISYTEMASILGVSLNTVVGWVKVHKMPNPTKGAKFEKCMDWIKENRDKLKIRPNTKLGKILSEGFYGDRKLHWYDLANLKYIKKTPL